jgi:hypothetical protein
MAQSIALILHYANKNRASLHSTQENLDKTTRNPVFHPHEKLIRHLDNLTRHNAMSATRNHAIAPVQRSPHQRPIALRVQHFHIASRHCILARLDRIA